MGEKDVSEKILAGKGKHEEMHSMCDVAERLKNAGWAEGWTKGLKEGKEEGLKEGKEEGLKEGKEEGLKEGLKEGQLLLVDTVNRLNAGESEEQLLAQGIDQKKLSLHCLSANKFHSLKNRTS